MPEPIYPEYIPLEDEHILPTEEQPLPPVVSPTAESPGSMRMIRQRMAQLIIPWMEDIIEMMMTVIHLDMTPMMRMRTESDPKEDPKEYEDDKTEDGPVDYPMDGGYNGDDDDAALPSPPLPPSSYSPPPIDRRDGILESEQPPRKRLCLSTLGSRYEVGESSTRVRGRVNLLIGDRMTLQETVWITEEEAYTARESWAQSSLKVLPSLSAASESGSHVTAPVFRLVYSATVAMPDVSEVGTPVHILARGGFEAHDESNEFLKSSVEDLEPNPSESDDTSGSDSECDLSSCENNSMSGNPTPSSDYEVDSVSPSHIPYEDSDPLLKETVILLSYFDNSSPEYETFSFDIEEKNSGSTTTHSDYSLSDYEVFYFDDDHIEGKSSGSTTTHSDFSLPEYDLFIFDLSIDPFPHADRSVSHH
nr:hypothetical protein [Tanacetum cinerariifolium]